MTYFTEQSKGKETGKLSRLSFPKEALLDAAYRLLGQNLWAKLCISFSESRCFLGSLRTQLAKGRASRSLGPSFEPHLRPWVRKKRTLARKRGIENLLAIYPWVGLQSSEIFLMGFDAGEQWAHDTQGNTQHPVQCESKSTSESN